MSALYPPSWGSSVSWWLSPCRRQEHFGIYQDLQPPSLISGSPTSSNIHSTESDCLHYFQSSNKFNYPSVPLQSPLGNMLSSKPVILNQGGVNQKHLGSFLNKSDSWGPLLCVRFWFSRCGVWRGQLWFLQSTVSGSDAHIHLVKKKKITYLCQDNFFFFFFFFYLSELVIRCLLPPFFITPVATSCSPIPGFVCVCAVCMCLHVYSFFKKSL